MKRGIGWITAIVVAVALAIAIGRGGREARDTPAPAPGSAPPAAGAREAARPSPAEGASARDGGAPAGALVLRPSARPAGAHPGIGFRSPQHLLDHFVKHGAEFGASGPSEYLAIAQRVRDAPAGDGLLEAVRADGVVTRFERTSGTFVAFDRDLTIRTCFKPNDGERYFRRQAARGGGGAP